MNDIKRLVLTETIINACLEHIVSTKPTDYSGIGYDKITRQINSIHKEIKADRLLFNGNAPKNISFTSFPDVILGNYAKFGMVKLFVIDTTILRLLYSKSALPKHSNIFKQTNGVLRPYMLTSINFYDGGFWTFGHND